VELSADALFRLTGLTGVAVAVAVAPVAELADGASSVATDTVESGVLVGLALVEVESALVESVLVDGVGMAGTTLMGGSSACLHRYV